MTVLAPRTPTTSTLVPFGNGSSERARNASLVPRTESMTSPGPSAPLVATINVPTQPITEASLTKASCSFKGTASSIAGRGR